MSSDATAGTSGRGGWRSALVYAAMIAATVGLFLVVRSHGEGLVAGGTQPHAGAAAVHRDVLMHVLLALAAIIVLGRVLGRLCLYVGQPRVIGEVLAGIALGPSLLGRIWPDATDYLLPAYTAPSLRIIAELGVVLYMFLVGLSLNTESLRARARATIAIAHASIVVPFALGVVLALWLFERYAPAGQSFTSFSLFLGVAMSITAFPVLARILTDRGAERSELGVMALGCAAIGDVTAWCLLALVVGVARTALDDAARTVVFTAAYVAVMVLAVRPLAVWFFGDGSGSPARHRTAVWALVSLLLSALAAEAIGIHAIFGAFLLGAVIPHGSAIAQELRGKLEDIVTILLLPAFFAFTGMRTEIGLLSDGEAWLVCGAIVLVATAGKFGGTFVAARWTGQPWRGAAALGILMNTRGLMELIVLDVGLDLGVISPEIFAMMVIMAVVTTVATTPILSAITGRPAGATVEKGS